MRLIYFISALIIFLSLLALYLFINTKNKNCTSSPSVFFNSTGEIYDKFLVTPDWSIVYSVNDSNNYSLKIYNEGKIFQLESHYENVFNPMLICGEISGLYDNKANEEYKSTSDELFKYIGANSIRGIYSFRNGNLILVQLQNDNGIYLIDFCNNTIIELFEISQKLNGAAFSEIGNYLIISYDDKLVYVDNFTLETFKLACELEGEKLNPYLFEDCVYFVNNNRSEYYQVFKIDLKNTMNPQVQPVFKLEHDIRMPKIKDKYLYFIEVTKSEYLLKKICLSSQKTEEITHQGVVYNYDFLKDESIVMAYSDVFTPRCVMIYNEPYKSLKNISGSRIDHDLSFQFLKSDSGETYAYELNKEKINNKGVILYVRPGGPHADFSPRWDAILMNLCNNGYIVLAPNFHMASGYGKTYYNSTNDQALVDLKVWKKYIEKKHYNLPLFCFSISSGNILMEKLITQDPDGINAAVSLFGIPIETSVTDFSIPKLYILGENDPFVDFSDRSKLLRMKKILHPSISIVSYTDEGHWFRKKNNLQDAVSQILLHFCLNSD